MIGDILVRYELLISLFKNSQPDFLPFQKYLILRSYFTSSLEKKDLKVKIGIS